jgi:hypothetical protein
MEAVKRFTGKRRIRPVRVVYGATILLLSSAIMAVAR